MKQKVGVALGMRCVHEGSGAVLKLAAPDVRQ